MRPQDLIIVSLGKIIKSLSLPEDSGFVVERPTDESHGDFSSNAALVLYRSLATSTVDHVSGEKKDAATDKKDKVNLWKNPRELALKLASLLTQDEELGKVFDSEKVEVAGSGFINFWLKDEYLVSRLGEVSETGVRCGESSFMDGKKVLVDFSSPNIAKRFSVGHLRSTIIGRAIYNLYQFSGAKVVGDNHLGDWGTQFGMIIAGVEEKNLDISAMSVDEMEQLYVEFNRRIEEEPELKEKAREAFARLERGEAGAREIWKKAISVSMDEFAKIYQKLDVPAFDFEYGESAYEGLMPDVIEETKKAGIAIESEGAWIVPFVDENGKELMPPAMLVKSNGTTTYFTRDLATVKKRLGEKELIADLYIYEVGSEQTLHFRQVFATVEKLGWAKRERFVHVAHGRMTLPEGKMSTRKGNTIKLEDLLDEANRRAFDMTSKKSGLVFGDTHAQVSDQSKIDKPSKVINYSEKIAVGAIKYNELRRAPGMDYVFKWDEALSMEGNSGPYLQYVYVRCRGILEKVNGEFGLAISINTDERKLLTSLLRFVEGEVVEVAARNFAPQLVCAYLFDLAQRFNGFYDRNQVSGSENQGFRLLLTKVTGQVLKNGLNLLGIEAVDKM